MKHLVIILISVVVLSACQPQKEDSRVLQESAPAAAGFSAERLAKIDNAMNIW